ncbi:NAD(P)-dependent dehydrogenase, short-chain alcohol dehydrogenase family [Salegentibacter holothuriorum]|uniref:NAD(P)-dependent dehydrogenase, short-chain alcohol dehydrogenase family n=1 Tax=Salegentibacter holothuriorum TaxID=241145 RepID=A0A1T5DHS2_9FLAO|nr:SDR family oxidoreductase [Salegentibacter holothuriorum]SKB71288.1 NAD(P)-dependent dehydrogenase, short-chain alcohol dehydrogenase family [Salegentibacter holothuriorum]
MGFNLKGKSSIITGGGSGIGKAISMEFASAGANVYILDYDEATAKSTVEDIISAGGNAKFYTCDVSSKEQINKIIDEIAEEASIDILVNNAGIAHVGNVENTNEDDLDRIYEVNIKGVFNCLKAVIPYMKSVKKGCIINMASIASVVGIQDRFAYSMSKGAVLTMTYSIAKDYIDYGIRCNSIAPARVHTPFVDGFITKNYPGKEDEMFEKLSKTQPIGRMGSTKEVAKLALYLASDDSAFTTGTNFPIDGGFIKLQG